MSKDFVSLVRECVNVSRELSEADQVVNQKLTAKAYLQRAIENAHTTNARLDELEAHVVKAEQLLAAGKPTSIDHVLSFLRRAREAVSAIGVGSLPEPFHDSSRMGYLGRDAAEPQLATLHFSVMELFALAVRRATKEKPDAFGTRKGTDGEAAHIEKLRNRRAELLARIGSGYRSDDLQFQGVGNGLALVSFALTGGVVPLYPTDNAGERLVAWCIANSISI